MVDDIKFSENNSDVLSMVIGGRPRCAMWQLWWWGLCTEMLSDRAC
jgi:hypothetical protein